MSQYKNELFVKFGGTVDSSFKKAVNEVSSSLKGITGKGGSTSQSPDTVLGNVGKQAKVASTNMGFLSGATKSVAGAFSTIARFSVAGGIFGGIIGGVSGAVTSIVEFDQALKNLQAITNATNFEVDAFGRKMIEVSNTTKFSANEVAQAMVYLGQSGFTARESLESIDAIASVATGTLTDFALTADLFTSAIRAFQLETTESARVADIFASAVNRSKLTVQGMRTIFNYVGASASQAGVSLEEAAAAAGILANNGMRMSTVGTSMRNVISRMIAPSKKMRTQLAYLGLSVEDVNPRMVGFQKAMENLSRIIVDQETGLADAGKAYELFGLRGQQAANVFVRAFTSGEFDKMLENITGVGEAFRQQMKQQEGLSVRWKNLTDRLRNFAVVLGEIGGNAVIGTIIDAVSSVVLEFQRLVDVISKAISLYKIWTGDLEEETRQVLKQADSRRSLATDINNYIQSLKNIQKEGKLTWQTEKEVEQLVDKLIEKYPDLAEEVYKYKNDLGGLITALEGVRKEQSKQVTQGPARALLDNIKATKEAQKQLDALIDKRKLLASSGSKGNLREQSLIDIKRVDKDIKKTEKLLDDLSQQAQHYRNELVKSAEDVGDFWEAQTKDAEKAKEVIDPWADTISKLGSEWEAAYAKVVSSGNISNLEKFINDAKQALADADEAVSTISSTGGLTAGYADTIKNTKLKEALSAFWDDINKEGEKKRLEAERAANKSFNRTTKAYKAALNAQVAEVASAEEKKKLLLVKENANQSEVLKEEEQFAKKRYDLQSAYYDELITLADETANARGDKENEVAARYRSEREALEANHQLKLTRIQKEAFEERMANPENLKDAWQSAMRSLESSTESSFSRIRDWMVNSVEEFADTSADAFLDFVEGTKSATEAFGDMAYSILRDLTKMIIKQQIMNALMQGAGMLSSSGGFLGTIGGMFTKAMGTNHSGGMAGKASSIKKQINPSAFINAPRFHNGGEVPAILQRGEEVKTRQQAAQDREPRNLSVIIENKSGNPVGNATATSTMNMGDEVIRIVLDGIDRNRNGLRKKIATVR